MFGSLHGFKCPELKQGPESVLAFGATLGVTCFIPGRPGGPGGPGCPGCPAGP